MAEIRIFDNCFIGSNSACISGDNIGVGPKHFQWRRIGPPTSPSFFTDGYLKSVHKYWQQIRCIGWLLEPYNLRPENYQVASKLDDDEMVEAILTYDARMLDDCKMARFYPFGGSWIQFDKWNIYEKACNVSIIASAKNSTIGHKLRHDVIGSHYRLIDDIYGHSYEYIHSKFVGLAPYRYSVVIESGRTDFYFTEKLIDCLSVGTVPIYWGCPSIDRFFNPDGIIQATCLHDIGKALKMACEGDYRSRIDAIKDNLERAKKYRVCEDWIWENYSEVFS